jgi:pimeloyl-ACP methyl ester carboxylesterase
MLTQYPERFPNARMAVTPQASHLHQIERPEIFAAVTEDFLRGVDQRLIQASSDMLH